MQLGQGDVAAGDSGPAGGQGLPYAEYDGFATFSKSYLYRLLSENGSILELDELEVLENTDSDYTSFIFDFTMPLMITAAVLFVVGITVRQLKWKDVTSFFSGLFRRRK